MIVTHLELNLSGATIRLANNSNRCTAYLELNDTIDPSFSEVSRTISSSELAVPPKPTWDNSPFEITNGSVKFIDNETIIPINVEYSFNANNYSSIQNGSVTVGRSLFNIPM